MSETQKTITATGEYAPINGLNLYYEIHGTTGSPLILLHGGLGSTGMFGEMLTALASGHKVIAVDLQGHGRTADIDRPFSFETMADDVAALARHIGLGKFDLIGYSLGGGVALQMTIRHPELVRKLVLVSTTFRRDGWHQENLAGMSQMGPETAEMLKQSPIYQAYASIAPRPDDWTTLVTKTGQLLRQDYDWSKGVRAIQAPTLLVIGDSDSVRPAHAVQFFELLGGGLKDANWDRSGMPTSHLAILPGVTHYDIFASPALTAVVAPFLDAPMPAPR